MLTPTDMRNDLSIDDLANQREQLARQTPAFGQAASGLELGLPHLAVNELRAKPGKDIQVIGSGELVQTLIANNLVDQFRLMVYPLVLGKGKKLFRDGAEANLKLVNSSSTKGGVLILTFEPR